MAPLRAYLCPALCNTDAAFTVIDIDSNSDQISPKLHHLAADITRQLREHIGDQNMITSFALHLEQCVSFVKSQSNEDGAPSYHPECYEARLIQISGVNYCQRFASFRRPAVLGIGGIERVSYS